MTSPGRTGTISVSVADESMAGNLTRQLGNIWRAQQQTQAATSLRHGRRWHGFGAAAVALISTAAQAQMVTDVQRAPTLTVLRYQEDWSYLSDPAKRSGRWTEPYKYIPLADDGTVYLTTGLELRSRYERYENLNWGASPDESPFMHRFMPYADLHAGKVRLFVQPIVTSVSGLERAKAPPDTTGADVTQGFAEVELPVAESTSLRLSAGRKLVTLGAGRLVDTRYGPGVPLPFDGLHASLGDGKRQLQAVYLRPVDTRAGDFNDRASPNKRVWGLYGTTWLDDRHRNGFDAYYLGFRDRKAVVDQGAGRLLVHSFGARAFGDDGAWYWNLEGVVQRGSFQDKKVRAAGIGGEVGRRFLDMPLQPVIAITSDYISGDHNPADDKLGTFTAIVPRGTYFASQSPVGPRNLIHVQPSVTIHPITTVAVSLSGVAYWRESTRDGIYNIPGFLVRSGQKSDARYIGSQIELAVAWQATPELNLSASASDFRAGQFVRETGPARTLRLVGLMANFRF